MKNLCLALLGWCLLLPLAGRAQNVLRLTDDLKKQYADARMAAQQKSYNPQVVIAASRKYFQLLANNETTPTTMNGLRKAYAENPFLQENVQQVGDWLDSARIVIKNTLNDSSSARLNAADRRRRVLLDELQASFVKQADMSADDTLNRNAAWPKAYQLLVGVLPLSYTKAAIRSWKNPVLAALRTAMETQLTPKAALELPKSLWPTNSQIPNYLFFHFVDSCLARPDKIRVETLYGKLREDYNWVAVYNGSISDHVKQKQNEQQIALLQQINQPIAPTINLLPGVGLPVLQGPLAAPRVPAPTSNSAEGALVDGTARFLADRLKQELSATFFQRFATLLHDTAYVELSLLYPATARLLTSGSADYGTIIQTLRSAFEQDLHELLFNYSQLLAKRQFYKSKIEAGSASGQLLRYTYVLVRSHYYLMHGTHPADLLPRLQTDLQLAGITSAAFQQTMALATALSGAVQDDNPMQRRWLRLDTLANHLKDPATQQFLMGLVWQRVVPQLDVAMRRLPQVQQAAEFQKLVANFLALSGQLQVQVAAIQAKAGKGERLGAEDFVALYQTLQSGIEFGRSYRGVADQLPEAEKQMTVLYQRVCSNLLQGYVAADKGDYGVTLSTFLDIVLVTLDPLAASGLSESAALRANAGMLLPQLSSQLAQSRLLNLSQVVRYGSFMAAIAQAKTSDDVKSALEAAALPSGSASIKRRSFFSVSVNAFAGVTAGGEWAYLPATQQPLPTSTPVDKFKLNLGPTAPIGLSFAWGTRGTVQDRRLRTLDTTGLATAGQQRRRQARLRRLDQAYRYYGKQGEERYLRGAAVGVFVSVLDLGVPVLLRLGDESKALPSNIGLRQVLAPGLFGFYHLRGLPLSAFIGGQFTPELRELSQVTAPPTATAPATTVNVQRNSLRLNAGLVVDIPFFQLFTRTEAPGSSPKRELIEKRTTADELFYAQRAKFVEDYHRLNDTLQNASAQNMMQDVTKQLDSMQTDLNRWMAKLQGQHITAWKLEEVRQEMEKLLSKAQIAREKSEWLQVARLRTEMDVVLRKHVPLLKADIEARQAQSAQMPKPGEQKARKDKPKPLIHPLKLPDFELGSPVSKKP